MSAYPLSKNLCLLALTGCLTLAAHAAGAAEVSISNPYVRLPPPGTPNTGAFMTIKNNDKKPLKLIKTESSVAKTVELHTHMDDNGVMRMRPVKEIEIKAGEQVELKPGSYHVMLIGLNSTLKEGEIVSLNLGFDDGSKVKVDAPVNRIQAGESKPAEHMHH